MFVPEPQVLGAFGVWRDGDFYNEDTIRGFSALVALQDGAVLDTCRRAPARRLVWEIGGGWGGFAHQFKTICPNVTHLITGVPESWLLSAVYLMTLFPHARFRFYGDAPAEDLWANWDTTDFVFVPEGAIPGAAARLDLTLDLGTLRHMDATRIAAHVRRAFDWGRRKLYSLLPAGAPADLMASV
jgi:putative sugar O-methyltransferase